MSTFYPRAIRALLVLVTAALTASAMYAQDELPTATISAAADGVTVPETLPEGLVAITFDNTAEAPFVPILLRLNDDVTMDDFMGAMGGDPGQMTELATLKGGTQINPASTVEVTYDFTPGNYALLNFAAEEPQVATFTVEDDAAVESGSQTEPEADLKVALVDFAFGIPVELKAGEQTWLLDNRGQQWHEMVVYKIDDKLSLADAKALVLESMTAEDPSTLGLEQAFLWLPMSEEQHAWVNLDLEPGTYAVACYLPDVNAETEEDMHSHMENGMIQFITVE
jgi:hypothetical protein